MANRVMLLTQITVNSPGSPLGTISTRDDAGTAMPAGKQAMKIRGERAKAEWRAQKNRLKSRLFWKFGRGGGIRTPNHRFWRPLFYQLELRPCNKRGELYKAGIKGKGFF